MSCISHIVVNKSRKKHRCHLCGCEIEVGTSYIKNTGVFDDYIYTSKFHPECDAIGSFMYRHGLHNGDGVTPDWFEDFVCRRLFEGGGYTREDVKKMSYYDMAKLAYNDLKEGKLKPQ